MATRGRLAPMQHKLAELKSTDKRERIRRALRNKERKLDQHMRILIILDSLKQLEKNRNA